MDGQQQRQDRSDLVETTRRFAEEVVAPRAPELDRQVEPEDCFSWEIVEQGSALGIRTATLSESYGGSGVDSLTAAMIIEALATADLGVSVLFAQTLKIVQTLQGAATEAQRERYLPPFADDPRQLLAIGISEPETASDYIIPYRAPTKRFSTTAVREGDSWRLNGFKHFISNGNRAGLYLVFAQTSPDADLVEGSTCFIVERETPGFTIGTVHDKMGERLVNNAELVFTDCVVPAGNVLGEVGGGFEMLRRFFPASNAYAAASVIGVAEAAYRRALEWAQTRVQGGRRLIEHDSTAEDLARLRMLIDAARAYIYEAARMADAPPRERDPKMGALPKVFASEVAWEVVTTALALHGGYGYMRELGMEKLVRDAAAFLHSDGTNRALLLKAAAFIRTGRRP
jgi:alkylation response protein AidB-like acyl-CoA dehydrogenase